MKYSSTLFPKGNNDLTLTAASSYNNIAEGDAANLKTITNHDDNKIIQVRDLNKQNSLFMPTFTNSSSSRLSSSLADLQSSLRLNSASPIPPVNIFNSALRVPTSSSELYSRDSFNRIEDVISERDSNSLYSISNCKESGSYSERSLNSDYRLEYISNAMADPLTEGSYPSYPPFNESEYFMISSPNRASDQNDSSNFEFEFDNPEIEDPIDQIKINLTNPLNNSAVNNAVTFSSSPSLRESLNFDTVLIDDSTLEFPVIPPKAPDNSCSNFIIYLSSVYKNMMHPANGLKLKSNRMHFKSFPNTLTGFQIIDWIASHHREIGSKLQACAVAKALIDFDYLTPANYNNSNLSSYAGEKPPPPFHEKLEFRENDLYRPGLATVKGIKLIKPSDLELYTLRNPILLTIDLSSVSTTNLNKLKEVKLNDSTQMMSFKSLMSLKDIEDKAIHLDKNANQVIEHDQVESINLEYNNAEYKRRCETSLLTNGLHIESITRNHLWEILSQCLALATLQNPEVTTLDRVDMARRIYSLSDSISSLVRIDNNYHNSHNDESPSIDIRDRVKVKRLPSSRGKVFETSKGEFASGEGEEIALFPGLVFTHNLVYKGMLARCRAGSNNPINSSTNGGETLLELMQPSLLMLRGPIEYQRGGGIEKVTSSLELRRLSSLEPIIMQEKEYLKNVVAKIGSLKPDLVIVQNMVSHTARELFAEAGIPLLHSLSKGKLFQNLACLTGADIIPPFLEGGQMTMLKPRLGLCKCFRLEKRTNKVIVFVEACPVLISHSVNSGEVKSNHLLDYCTVLLKSPRALRVAPALKRIIKFAIFSARHLSILRSFLNFHASSNALVNSKFIFESIASSYPKIISYAPEQDIDSIRESETRFKSLMLLKSSLFSLPSSYNFNEMRRVEEYEQLLDNLVLCITPGIKFSVPLLELPETDTDQLNLLSLLPRDLYYSPPFASECCDNKTDSNSSVISNESSSSRKDTLTTSLNQFTCSTDDDDFIAAFRYGDLDNTIPSPPIASSPCEEDDEKREEQSESAPRIDCFDTFHLQILRFLFYSFASRGSIQPTTRPSSSSHSGDYCIAPRLVTAHFYGAHDVSLRNFLRRFCFDPDYACPSPRPCKACPADHVRRFVHGSVRIDISLLKTITLSSSSNISHWIACRDCGARIASSPFYNANALGLSFAAFLEALFYDDPLFKPITTCQILGCPSTKRAKIFSALPVHYFGMGEVTASFTVKSITLGRIVFPPSPLRYNLDYDQIVCHLSHEFQNLTEVGQSSFGAVLDRLQLYSVDAKALGAPVVSSISDLSLIAKVDEYVDALEKDRITFNDSIHRFQLALMQMPEKTRSLIASTRGELIVNNDNILMTVENYLGETKSLLSSFVYYWNLHMSEIFLTLKNEKNIKIEKTSESHDKPKDKMEGKERLNASATIIPSISHQIEDADHVNPFKTSLVKEDCNDDNQDCKDKTTLVDGNRDSNRKETNFTVNLKNKFASFLTNSVYEPINAPFSQFEHLNLPFNGNDHLRVNVSEEIPSSIIAYSLSTLEHDARVKEKTRNSREVINKSVANTASTEAHEKQTLTMDSAFVSKDANNASDKIEESVTNSREKDGAEKPKNDHHLEMHFNDSITSAKFYCKIYFASNFSRLRSVLFPSGEILFCRSLSQSAKWLSGGGKSGSSFSKTRDGRFLLKQMSRLELQSFLDFAPYYFNYVHDCIPCSPVAYDKTYIKDSGFGSNGIKIISLAKIVGAYRVSCKNSSNNTSFKQDVIVMENLFYDTSNIQYVFDLKGSMRNRLVNVDANNEPEERGGGKDGSSSKRDTGENQNIVTNTPQFTIPSSSGVRGLKIVTGKPNEPPTKNEKNSQDSKVAKSLNFNETNDDIKPSSIVLLDENFIRLTLDSPLYVHAHSKLILMTILERDTAFLAQHKIMDYSLLVAWDSYHKNYVVGIIDYIRTFTWDKRLEMVVKKSGILGGQGKMPTIVSPSTYRHRFLEAMKSYFLVVPDHWFGLSNYANI
ncbi:1-phosphatidylinositol 3-phosphate 5-kinase-like isoform X2 [Gordionus sp. m RMFG-2023]